jgi:AcrR family transcriptional regulator
MINSNITLTQFFKKERTVLFQSVLSLIQDGKFHNMSMGEIAYRANLTESTSNHLFESKDKLIREVCEFVFETIGNLIIDVTKQPGNFETHYFMLWEELFEYYSPNPGALILVEETLMSKSVQKAHAVNVANLLSEFFQLHNDAHRQIPSNMAYIFHANVMSAVKLTRQQNLSAGEVKEISEMLWKGVSYHYRKTIL